MLLVTLLGLVVLTAVAVSLVLEVRNTRLPWELWAVALLALAPLACLFLTGYSYTKYFTWTSHWVLGFTDGLAAAGGWIAVTGSFAACTEPREKRTIAF